MSIARRAVDTMRLVFGERASDYALLTQVARGEQTENIRGMYDLLRDLYYNERSEVEGENHVHGWRNPAHAVVEFYVNTVWPGPLPDALPIIPGDDVKDRDALIAAVHQVWSWSNWSVKKQVHVRTGAMLGEVLLKAATHENAQGQVDRTYLQTIKPDYLTEFDTDDRGYITYIRLDVPRSDRQEDGTTEDYTITEIWDKARPEMFLRVWRHEKGLNARVADMGEPVILRSVGQVGVDFVPFVHTKHLDVGEPRGVAPIVLAMAKAQQANRLASRQHDLMYMFNKPEMFLESSLTDEDGNPIVPPIIEDEGDVLTIGGVRFWRVPGGWTMRPSVPDLKYDAQSATLSEHMLHMQQTDLPELGYYQIADMGSDLSGKALNIVLIPAVAKAEEARGNYENGLIRGQQMCLTIGQRNRLPGFENLGLYEAGGLDHSFDPRPVLPLTDEEEAAIDKTKAETAAIRKGYGYSREFLMRQDGLEDDEITENLSETTTQEAGAAVIGDDTDREAQALLAQAMNRNGATEE